MEYLLWICSTAHLGLPSRLCTWPFLCAAYMGLCFLVFFFLPYTVRRYWKISRLDVWWGFLFVWGFFCLFCFFVSHFYKLDFSDPDYPNHLESAK